VWGGLRLGQSDVVLATISPTEAALSIRSPVGIWAVLLSLGWFALAYRSRAFAAWEPVLVVVGGVVALLRLGNTWLDAIAMVLPLARELRMVHLPATRSGLAVLLCVGAAGGLLALGRPPSLPRSAVTAAQAGPSSARVLAYWAWAPELQQQLGSERTVIGANGFTSETPQFWTEYVGLSLGHERWAYVLRQRSIDLVVLNTTDQAAAADLVRASADWRVLDDADDALVAEREST
jgi:hypothetical protein